MNKTAKKNVQIIAAAAKIAKALEDETEDILRDAEEVVHKHFPARYVKAALTEIEKILDANGVQASFDKTVTKEALKTTASVKYSGKDLHGAVRAIAKATLDEFEDMLEDGDEVATRAMQRFASKEQPEVESKLKNMIERRLHHLGIFCKLSRVSYDPQQLLKKSALAIAAAKKKTAESRLANKKTASKQPQNTVKDKITNAIKRARARKAN